MPLFFLSLFSSFLLLTWAQSGGDTPALYNYPQPALPSTWAYRDASSWTLSPDWEITDVPVSPSSPFPPYGQTLSFSQTGSLSSPTRSLLWDGL